MFYVNRRQQVKIINRYNIRVLFRSTTEQSVCVLVIIVILMF
jgi:hypothetical protein